MPEETLTAEATQILEQLTRLPFNQCYSLQPSLTTLPKHPGLYAIRHETLGILYIGKTLNPRQRFMDGHKALYRCYLDRYPPETIRIAIIPITNDQRQRLLDLEARMIQIAKPRYNSVIRQRAE